MALALENGIAGFYNNEQGSPLFSLIQSAQRSIDLEIYEMGDKNVRDSLREAIKRGVALRVVQDPHPLGGCPVFNPITRKDSPDCEDQKKFVQEVNQTGGRYVGFNRKELCGVSGQPCFQHGKIAIFDHKLSLISSGNFNSTNLCDSQLAPDRCNRDYSIVSDDLEVNSLLNSIFEKDLEGRQYDLSEFITPDLSNKITVSPVSLKNILNFIRSAKSSIQVQNQYLNEPEINQALIAAAGRRVKVDITVASFCSFGRPSPSKNQKYTEIFSAFDQAGISTRLFTKNIAVGGRPGYLHAKAIVVDETRAWVGSMNGSTQSALMNREYGIYFDHPQWVMPLLKIMQSDHANPRGETWQEGLQCEND